MCSSGLCGQRCNNGTSAGSKQRSTQHNFLPKSGSRPHDAIDGFDSSPPLIRVANGGVKKREHPHDRVLALDIPYLHLCVRKGGTGRHLRYGIGVIVQSLYTILA
jgi:hypothetical protein